MPRSNKKKKLTYQPAVPADDNAVALLLGKEKTLMISRAIVRIVLFYFLIFKYFFQASAQRHGIKLRHGSSNPGTGDCAFEAAIHNVNDRPCFHEKFYMSTNWYRRIWVTDMANRTLYTDYNMLSNKEWLEGWSEMLEPGAYERGIFGDLMLPGIACGIRKIILIFNTNPDSPHDPIYVVNPLIFNVMPDSEIPVVLAYNMSHYESMEPCTDHDTQSTVALVEDYLEGRYSYNKYDLPHLICMQIKTQQDNSDIQLRNKQTVERKKRKSQLSDDKLVNVVRKKDLESQETQKYEKC